MIENICFLHKYMSYQIAVLKKEIYLFYILSPLPFQEDFRDPNRHVYHLVIYLVSRRKIERKESKTFLVSYNLTHQ